MSLGASPQPHDPGHPAGVGHPAIPARGGSAPADGAAVEAVAADYTGAWIGGVIPALLAGRAPRGLPAWVASAAPVVVLLIDGLGWRMAQRFAPLLPALTAFEGGPITSVVPSTTAAALPSLTTGVTPAEHGVLGDRMRVGGAVLNVLQWTVPDASPPDPAEVQPHAPFCGRPVPVVSHAKFAGSGFSRAHLRGAVFFGYDDAAGLVGRVAAALDSGAPLVFAYLPDADRTAHERGLAHDAFAAALRTADRIVADLRRRLPRDGALVITADHGHVTVDPEQRVDLSSLTPLVAATSGSARMRYLHARAGALRELLPAARELVGDRAWVLDRAELVSAGWLGPRPSPLLTGRLGDVVMMARAAATMVDPSEGRLNDLVTVHGSVTADEMLVPLLAARGEAST